MANDIMDRMIGEKICTVTTIRAPVHETIMFVNYHINIGIDHMILFFDDPDDMSIDALSGHEQVTCIRCGSQYSADLKLKSDILFDERQSINASLGLKIARESGYDWIIHIDSDELIHSEEPLKTMLSRVPKDVHAVRFMPLEAAPEKMRYNRFFEEIALFKVLPRRRQKYLAYLLDCKKAFFKGDYFRGHLIGKSATRITSDISGIGIHKPVAVDGKKLNFHILSNAKLLHFDCCGFEIWKTKWLRRHIGLVNCRIRKNRECQFENFVRLYKEGNNKKLEKLYSRLYCLSKFEKFILSKIGLLKQIYLKRELFEYAQGANLEVVLKQ